MGEDQARDLELGEKSTRLAAIDPAQVEHNLAVIVIILCMTYLGRLDYDTHTHHV